MTIKSKLLVGLGIPVMILVIVGLGSHFNNTRLVKTMHWKAHTYEVLGTLENLISYSKDLETGQRGFILSSNEIFLEPYLSARKDVYSELERLATLTADNPSQQRMIERLRPLLDAKIAESKRSIQYQRKGDHEAAMAVVRSGRGKQLMDGIRALTVEMRSAESHLLRLREESARASIRIARLSTTIGLATAVMLVVLVTFLTMRSVLSRIGTAVNIARRLSSGERDIAIDDSSADEVGTLLHALKKAQASILESETALQAVTTQAQDSNAKLQHAVATLSDSEQRMGAILDTTVDGIIVIDEQRNIKAFNPAAERLFGYADDEVMEQNVKLLMPEPYQSAHDGYVRNYVATGDAKVIGTGREVEGKRKDGTVFPLELAVSEMQVAGERMFTGVVRDITERKQAEREILAARDAAEAANVAKSSFLANMSHELRTPLNAIIGYSEMLEEEAQELKLDTFVPDLERIHGAGKHLLTLINDILDLSKIEAGSMELLIERFPLQAFLDDVVSMTQPLAKKNTNRLKLVCAENSGLIATDEIKLRQILFNLLSNAAKFTENGEIQLEVKREGLADTDWVIFRVQDTGIGMDPEQLEGIFSEFVQADRSTTRRFGGTGLGLAISRRYCEMLGGSLKVESSAGVGSTFTARIPAQTPEPVTDVMATENPRSALNAEGKPIILIIEDEPEEAKLLERQLHTLPTPCQVVIAIGGVAGLRLARELQPALITLDVLMPDINGWNVLEKLRQLPETRDIPVVMCTVVDDKKRGYALGATDYLVKPIQRDRLFKALEKYPCTDPPCRALVVEDDEATNELFCRTLEKLGWEVNHADNGREGMERLVQQLPDLVLLDLMMPEMDGFEFLERLRENPEWASISVIIITAKDLSEDERHRLKRGVERIIDKNSDTDSLLEEITSIVGQGAPCEHPHLRRPRLTDKEDN